MIQKSTAYSDSKGGMHLNLGDAQEAELKILCEDKWGVAVTKEMQEDIASAVSILVAHKEKVLDVLTTKETSRVKARKVNGAVKKRGAAADKTAATV